MKFTSPHHKAHLTQATQTTPPLTTPTAEPESPLSALSSGLVLGVGSLSLAACGAGGAGDAAVSSVASSLASSSPTLSSAALSSSSIASSSLASSSPLAASSAAAQSSYARTSRASSSADLSSAAPSSAANGGTPLSSSSSSSSSAKPASSSSKPASSSASSSSNPASSSSSAASSTNPGSSSSASSTPASSSAQSSSSAPQVSINSKEAVSFLAQASLSSKADEITRVQTLGYEGWLNEQMQKPLTGTNVEYLKNKGFDDFAFKNSASGCDNMIWRRLLSSDDSLRMRVALALSEIIVVGLDGTTGRFRQFAMAYYLDILEANAFGNYRNLLEQISKSPVMAGFLTFLGNRKSTGVNMPDENYAREVMQLFSIGVYELNLDGSLKLTAGKSKETYVQDDVSQLARVFTGWNLDTSTGTNDTPDAVYRPMVQVAKYHELGEKRFLGTVIPVNTDGEQSLQLALNTLMAHANMAPFICRQLIQRLVTSDPAASYVARVAGVFNDNGQGVKGDLGAVVKAILLDTEARSAARLSSISFGKLREPMLRFVHWARNFGIYDNQDDWTIGNLSDPASRLGQSPLRSSSVFNFFRPGYIPPSSFIGERTVPEFQITTETSIAGYLNYMQTVISNGVAGLKPNYAALASIATDSSALLNELNTSLAAGLLATTTLNNLKTALDTINTSTNTGLNNRIYAAVLLVMASPEYLTQK